MLPILPYTGTSTEGPCAVERWILGTEVTCTHTLPARSACGKGGLRSWTRRPRGTIQGEGGSAILTRTIECLGASSVVFRCYLGR